VSKAVLVTGANSGIGRKITEHLAADGYFVYAAARKEEDLKALGAIKNVQPLHLDVTQPADIAAAVAAVTKAGRGLYGLVNNAGVATFGTIADMRMEEFDLTMKVKLSKHSRRGVFASVRGWAKSGRQTRSSRHCSAAAHLCDLTADADSTAVHAVFRASCKVFAGEKASPKPVW
jgi:NAD(P)-dependent dehydrogenase (short-subunit alcohol dehydrogenase family)